MAPGKRVRLSVGREVPRYLEYDGRPENPFGCLAGAAERICHDSSTAAGNSAAPDSEGRRASSVRKVESLESLVLSPRGDGVPA